MATRKEARKKSLLQLLALIIAVAVIVVSVVLFQNWWNSRPGPGTNYPEPGSTGSPEHRYPKPASDTVDREILLMHTLYLWDEQAIA